MIHISFEGGLGNQMFQYAYGRYLQKYYNESVCYDISKYSFEKSENREFDLCDMNINPDWKREQLYKSRFGRYGIRYLVYLLATFIYVKGNKLVHDDKNMHGVHEYQAFINFFGFYRNHTHQLYYEPIHRSMFKKKYIRGHWFNPQVVREMDNYLRREFRVTTVINTENQKMLNAIANSNSVAVHIRRGDYVTLGYVACSLGYYQHCIEVMAKKLNNPVFFVFSDDIAWVRNNLKTIRKVVFIDIRNKAVDDMRLLQTCKHFIISNSTFSWWGAWLSENSNKIVLQPMYWSNKNKYKHILCIDEWDSVDNSKF